MKGVVKFFKSDRGYGFITSDEGEHFFHFTQVVNDAKLQSEDEVEFDSAQTTKGLQAENIRLKVKNDRKETR